MAAKRKSKTSKRTSNPSTGRASSGQPYGAESHGVPRTSWHSQGGGAAQTRRYAFRRS